MAKCEMYGVCGDECMGVWLPMGTARNHNLLGLSWAMDVHVLGGTCINHSRIMMSLAGCVGSWQLQGYSTMCVCWIGVCGLFGVLLCCVRLCEDLLCVGGCRWRVGVRSHVSILWFGQLRLEYISSRKMLF